MKRLVAVAVMGTALCALLAAPVMGQPDEGARDDQPLYGNGIGLNIALTNSGFAIGGFWQRALTQDYTFITEFTLGAGKDGREQRLFNFWGESYIPGKANYLLMMPINVGVQRRLFADAIEENFRPFIQVTGGPTVGWVSPYFNDRNENGIWDSSTERTYDSISAVFRGKPTLGTSALVAVGASFGRSRRVTQSLRFGVSMIYFPQGVRLLEERFEEDRHRLFISPVISLSFGRSRR